MMINMNEQSSFSNLSVSSPTSQFILQPFCCFTYVTAHSPTLLLLHICHSSFSNPSFTSPTSQVLHLIHLASRPCFTVTTQLQKCTELRAWEKLYIQKNINNFLNFNITNDNNLISEFVYRKERDINGITEKFIRKGG